MAEAHQRKLLGQFLRAHRERVETDRPGRRRRTPGLRREELAERAGISATWCTWLEQGRDVQASPQALSRLAQALFLSRAERAYLFQLAGRIDPDASGERTTDVPEALEALVALLEQPAYGLDGLWNACCWNPAASRLFRGWLDGEHDRNLLRFVFLDDAARALIPNWEERARRLLAEFRADYSRTFRDAHASELVDHLMSNSALFSEAWEDQAVEYRVGGLRSFFEADGHLIQYVQHTYLPLERSDYKLVVLIPDSSA